MHTEAVRDASGETEQIIEEEPIYPDMPAKLTYQKALVWKSHKCDELWFQLKDLEKKYRRRVAPDVPFELLTSPENLRIYNWIKSLSNNEQGIRSIDYAYKHGKIDDNFMDDLDHEDSPFFIPLAGKWAQGFWEGEKSKLELEMDAKTKELQHLVDEIKAKTAQSDTDLRALTKERETVLKKLETEKAKLEGIEKKSKAINVLTDWLRKFYAGKIAILPEDDDRRNSIFKVENELHILGLYGICNNCRPKLEKEGRWPT